VPFGIISGHGFDLKKTLSNWRQNITDVGDDSLRLWIYQNLAHKSFGPQSQALYERPPAEPSPVPGAEQAFADFVYCPSSGIENLVFATVNALGETLLSGLFPGS